MAWTVTQLRCVESCEYAWPGVSDDTVDEVLYELECAFNGLLISADLEDDLSLTADDAQSIQDEQSGERAPQKLLVR